MIFCHQCFKLWSDDIDFSHCDCGQAVDQMSATPEIHPVQLVGGKSGTVRVEVAMAAYEVYCKVFAPQPAMVTGRCRGGFGTGELVAMLYARAFPRNEWRKRFDEAIENSRLDR